MAMLDGARKRPRMKGEAHMRRMALRVASCVVVAGVLGASAPAPEALQVKPGAGGPVLMDGRCTDDAWRTAESRSLGNGVSIRFLKDASFLYVCVEPPADSFATFDLYLQTKEGQFLNLHASAQLGERVRGEASWPDFTWGNNANWAANVNQFAGFDRAAMRSRFANAIGREMQISRAKLGGNGSFPMMATIQQISTPEGMATVRFPENADEDAPATWGTLVLD